jgi:integrase
MKKRMRAFTEDDSEPIFANSLDWMAKVSRGYYLKGSVLAGRHAKCVSCHLTKFKIEYSPLVGCKLPLCINCKGPPNKLKVRKLIPSLKGKGKVKDFARGVDDQLLTTVADALALIGKINEELLLGTFRPENYDAEVKEKLKFSTYAKYYIEYKERRTKLPQEHEEYLTPAAFRNSKWLALIVLVKYFKDTDIRRITKLTIKEFERSWMEKFRTRDLALGELKTMLRFAKSELRILEKLPDFPSIKRARHRRIDEIPSVAVQAKIIQNIKNRTYRAAWTLAAVYAKRACEVRAYKVKDVCLIDRTLTTCRHFSVGGKGVGEVLLNGRKSIKLDCEQGVVLDTLDDYMVILLKEFITGKKPNDFLFPHHKTPGEFIRRDILDSAWRRAAGELGLERYRPYAGTKHSTLSDLLKDGGDYASLKNFSAHTNVITLERYAKTRAEDKKGFVKTERFLEI